MAQPDPNAERPRTAHPEAASRPRKKRRLLRFLGWTLAAVVLLTLVAGGLGVWTAMRSWPKTSGTIEASGLEHAVTVQRDASGIPTITAESSHDLFFAQGFVHAQDRFWEMDFRRHVTSGRLSELFGESQVGTDTFLRTLGWHDIAQREVDALPERVRAYYEAYADGVNAYLSEHRGADLSLEYAVLALQNSGYEPEPWTPADSVAWLKAMAWDLRTNIEEETARALLARQLDPALLAELYPAYPFDEHPVIVDRDWAAGSGAAASAEAAPAEAAPNPAEASETATTDVAPGAASDVAPAGFASWRDTSAALTRVDALISSLGEGIGSNSWVVSGKLTDTGMPLLANDPHLGAELPSVWTQMQLRCAEITDGCPFEVAGFSFSGLPGIVIGHNEDIAWGFTNLTTDVADLYVERIDGDDYWQDGERHPLVIRTETLKVAGGEDVTFEVRSTGHGPVVSGLTDDFTAIAADPRLGTVAGWREAAVMPGEEAESLSGEFAVTLRWTALDPGTTAEAIFDLDLADDFDDFRAAAAKFDVPAQNLVYADVQGNIGYQAPGRLPIRGAGDGWLPQPGWDSAYDWQGYVPFEEQPYDFNPEAGYIATANNAIVTDDYPYFLSRDWDYGYRAARIVEMLEQRIDEGPLTSEALAEMQMDNLMPAASALQGAYTGLETDDPEVREALDGLAAWDGQNDADSAEAAYANVLWKQVVGLMTGGKGADVPLDDQSRFVLFFEQELERPDSAWWSNAEAGVTSQEELLGLAARQAYDELAGLQGEDQAKWSWGKLHAITLTHGSFGASGIGPIEWLFNRGPYPVGGGSGVVNATGWNLAGGYATETVPSMRMVVDLDDWDASTWVHLTGASGHAFHPHYTDQTEDWATGIQRPWPFSPDAVTDAARDTLTLRPAS